MKAWLSYWLVRIVATGLTGYVCGPFIYGFFFLGSDEGFGVRFITGIAWAILWPIINDRWENATPAFLITWGVALLVWVSSEYLVFLREKERRRW